MPFIELGSNVSGADAQEMGWGWWDRIKANYRQSEVDRLARIEKAFATPVPVPAPAPTHAKESIIPSRSITKAAYEARVLIIARNLAGARPVNFMSMQQAKLMVDSDMKRKNISIVGHAHDISDGSKASNIGVFGSIEARKAMAWKYVAAGAMAFGVGLALHSKR